MGDTFIHLDEVPGDLRKDPFTIPATVSRRKANHMKFSGSSAILLFFIVISVFSSSSLVESSGDVRRMMMSFKETPNGGNVTFDCSPSGPCVPCAYSEKVSLSLSGIFI